MEAVAPISDRDVKRSLVTLHGFAFEETARRAEVLVTEYFQAFPEELPVTLSDRLVLRLSREGSLFKTQTDLHTKVLQIMNRLVKSNRATSESDDIHDTTILRTCDIDPALLFQHAVMFRASIDPKTGRMVHANNYAVEKLGYTRRELYAQNLVEFFVEEDRPKAIAIVKQLVRDGEVRNVEIRFLSKKGVPVPMLLNIGSIRDTEGRVICSNTTGLDLSYINEIRANVDHAKQRFLAMTSHELKTQLQGILGGAEQLERKLRELSEETCQEDLSMILECSHQLRRLIDDILDLSQIQVGKLRLRPEKFCLAALFGSKQFELLRTQAHAKGLTLDVKLDPNIPKDFVADPSGLLQIFTNLTSDDGSLHDFVTHFLPKPFNSQPITDHLVSNLVKEAG